MTRPIDPKLQQLLDVYGADRSRWPAAADRQFAALTGAEAEAAGTALRETAALDRVLARASVVADGRQTALADRIMAQVQAEAAAQGAVAGSAGSNVVALPQRRAAPQATFARPSTRFGTRLGIDWRAAAALAAALVVGVGVGLSGSASPTFQAMAETVGGSLGHSVLAFNDDQGGAMATLDDEDVL
jgi:hypothetical protein